MCRTVRERIEGSGLASVSLIIKTTQRACEGGREQGMRAREHGRAERTRSFGARLSQGPRCRNVDECYASDAREIASVLSDLVRFFLVSGAGAAP